MYLYNSLTHKKELFQPNSPDVVKMYTCGPTVYHFAHIGNLRTYIIAILGSLISVGSGVDQEYLVLFPWRQTQG